MPTSVVTKTPQATKEQQQTEKHQQDGTGSGTRSTHTARQQQYMSAAADAAIAVARVASEVSVFVSSVPLGHASLSSLSVHFYRQQSSAMDRLIGLAGMTKHIRAASRGIRHNALHGNGYVG